MAPNGEVSVVATMAAPLLATIIGSFGNGDHKRQRMPSSHELRNCAAGHSKEVELLSSDGCGPNGCGDPRDATARSPEVEDAECECCGMSEECTPAYIGAVRRRFSGRWVCGLCAEAVAEEAGKNGGDREAALAAHTAVCRRFNGFGRTHPALFQADAVIEMVRKLSVLRSPMSPAAKSGAGARVGAVKANAGGPGCMALVAGVRNDKVVMN